MVVGGGGGGGQLSSRCPSSYRVDCNLRWPGCNRNFRHDGAGVTGVSDSVTRCDRLVYVSRVVDYKITGSRVAVSSPECSSHA